MRKLISKVFFCLSSIMVFNKVKTQCRYHWCAKWSGARLGGGLRPPAEGTWPRTPKASWPASFQPVLARWVKASDIQETSTRHSAPWLRHQEPLQLAVAQLRLAGRAARCSSAAHNGLYLHCCCPGTASLALASLRRRPKWLSTHSARLLQSPLWLQSGYNLNKCLFSIIRL